MGTRWLTIAAITVSISGLAQAQIPVLSVAHATRQLVGTKSAAVVRIETVLEYSYESGDGTTKEENNEGVATIIDPSGTALVNYELIAYNKIADDMGPKSVKLISATLDLSDGSEVPVEVVAKDAELGLALVRPKAALAKPMSSIAMSLNAPIAVGDILLTLGRMDASTKFAVNILRMTVCSIFENPRQQFVFEEGSDDALPVFTLKGEFVGMTVGIPTSGQGRRGLANGMRAASEIVKFLNKAKSASVKIGDSL